MSEKPENTADLVKYTAADATHAPRHETGKRRQDPACPLCGGIMLDTGRDNRCCRCSYRACLGCGDHGGGGDGQG